MYVDRRHPGRCWGLYLLAWHMPRLCHSRLRESSALGKRWMSCRTPIRRDGFGGRRARYTAVASGESEGRVGCPWCLRGRKGHVSCRSIPPHIFEGSLSVHPKIQIRLKVREFSSSIGFSLKTEDILGNKSVFKCAMLKKTKKGMKKKMYLIKNIISEFICSLWYRGEHSIGWKGHSVTYAVSDERRLPNI